MLAKTTIVGISLCAALGLVALANVAAPAADAYGTPETDTTQSGATGAAPSCLVIVQHAHVEGPICSSHFSYKKTVGSAEGPGHCGCPVENGPAQDGATTTTKHDNDVVDAKGLVTVGDVHAHDLVDVKGNDIDILEDIVEKSDVDVVEENVVGVGAIVGGLL